MTVAMGPAGNALGRRAPLALAALALALLAHSLAASAAPAASPAAAPPPVTISPLPGTPDASPQTQISFLGVPAGDLSGVTVIGSRSGRHGGRLAAYANGEGASFLVARRFTPGE